MRIGLGPWRVSRTAAAALLAGICCAARGERFREPGRNAGVAGRLQGTTDLQVSVEDAQLLAAAKPDATLDIVADMMRELKHATLDDSSQRFANTDPSLPIVKDVVDRSLALVLGSKP